MGAATPPRVVPPAPAAPRVDPRAAAASQVRYQGAQAPEAPPANAEHARILERSREMERIELEQRLQVGQPDPTLVGTPGNRPPRPPEEEIALRAASQGNAALGIGRVAAEAGLAYATGGLSFPTRVGATALGEAVLEPTYGALLNNTTENVVEDALAGAAAGGLSEVAVGGLGAGARGVWSLGRRILRGPVSQRGRSLAVQHAVDMSRQVGAQPSASMVLDSPMLTKIEQYVENSIGGGPLRNLRERNIESVRKALTDQIELVPSPQGYDLDAFLAEVLDGRLDAARGHAAAYYKATFDTAAGRSASGVRFRPKVPSDFAREQLADQRLGFAALQDDAYKDILLEMIQTKGGVTFERMQRWRSQLFAYSKMFDPSGRVKAEAQAQAARMAHVLTENMGNAAKAMGRGNEWQLANQIWADEVAGLYTTQMLRRIARDEPTKVARSLLRNGTGTEVKALRKALGIADDGSYRAIAQPTTPEGVLAAKEQEKLAREAWRRVQGAHLWNTLVDSSRIGLDLANPAAARQALTPSGDNFLAVLFNRGDAKGDFVRALYNTPEAAQAFARAARLGETLRYYQAVPEGGGIALRVIETQAIISVGLGVAAGVATGDVSTGLATAGGAGLTMLVGERGMASLMANPRFVAALESGIRAVPGSNAAKRAGLLLSIEILRDSSISDAVRAQADAAVAQLSSAVGVSPDDARKAAGRDAGPFVNRARPLVTDRADVGGPQ